MNNNTVSDITIANPNVKVGSRRVIYTCPCGTVAFDYVATRRLKFTDKFGVKKWSDAVLTREVDGVMRDVSRDYTCPGCKRTRKSATVQGTVTEHVCGAKCRTSKGPTCECSCGGAHHGAGYLSK